MTPEELQNELCEVLERAKAAEVPLYVVLGILEIIKVSTMPVVLREEET